MSISPNALSGWAIMMRSFAKTLDVKTRDGIALAVSEADGCDYCLAAHSFIAGNLGKIPADEIELNREGRSSDPKRQAAVAFAKALIETRCGKPFHRPLSNQRYFRRGLGETLGFQGVQFVLE